MIWNEIKIMKYDKLFNTNGKVCISQSVVLVQIPAETMV